MSTGGRPFSICALGALGQLVLDFVNDTFHIFPEPPKPITVDDVKLLISEALKHALDEAAANQVVESFKSATEAYIQRFTNIKNANKDIKDQTKWNLGKPNDWESVVNVFNDIKSKLFNSAYSVEYPTSLFITSFITLYQTVLYTKLKTHAIGDDISSEYNMLRTFYTAWYSYMAKLSTYARVNVISNSDAQRTEMGRIRVWPFVSLPFYCILDTQADRIDNDNPYSQERTSREAIYNWKEDVLSPAVITLLRNLGGSMSTLNLERSMYMTRATMFFTQATPLLKLCEIYDASVKEFNKTFKDNLPTDAVETIFNHKTAQNYVSARANDFQKSLCGREDWEDQWNCLLFGLYCGGLRKYDDMNRKNHFEVDETLVKVTFSNGSVGRYPLGDYIFKQPKNAQSPQADVYPVKITIPRGFRVILYDSYKLVAGAQNSLVLPADFAYIPGTDDHKPSDPTLLEYDLTQGQYQFSKCQSMQVRFDFNSGFMRDPSRYTTNFLRVATYDKKTYQNSPHPYYDKVVLATAAIYDKLPDELVADEEYQNLNLSTVTLKIEGSSLLSFIYRYLGIT